MTEKELVLIHPDVKSNLEVLDILSGILFERGYVKKSYRQAVKDRELAFPTGIMMKGDIGLAIPHADCDHVRKTGYAIAILAQPIEFKAMGAPDESVAIRLVVMLAINDPKQQLEMLQSLITVFDEPKTLQDICDCVDADSVCRIMRQVG